MQALATYLLSPIADITSTFYSKTKLIYGSKFYSVDKLPTDIERSNDTLLAKSTLYLKTIKISL